jgi:uncharacterized protein
MLAVKPAYFLLFAALLWAWPAAAQSVDCDAPQTRDQQLICSDPQLRGLDRRVNGDYRLALLVAEPPDYFRLKRSQPRFLAARDACRSEVCLYAVLEERRDELRAVLRTPRDIPGFHFSR